MKHILLFTLFCSVVLLSSCGGAAEPSKDGTEATNPDAKGSAKETAGNPSLSCNELLAEFEAIATEYNKLADDYYETGKLNEELQKNLDEKKAAFDRSWDANESAKKDRDCVMRFAQTASKFSQGAIRMSEGMKKHGLVGN